jgi:hypothetical protein
MLGAHLHASGKLIGAFWSLDTKSERWASNGNVFVWGLGSRPKASARARAPEGGRKFVEKRDREARGRGCRGRTGGLISQAIGSKHQTPPPGRFCTAQPTSPHAHHTPHTTTTTTGCSGDWGPGPGRLLSSFFFVLRLHTSCPCSLFFGVGRQFRTQRPSWVAVYCRSPVPSCLL